NAAVTNTVTTTGAGGTFPIPANSSVNVNQWDATALGAPTAWGVAPTGNMIGANVNLIACASGVCNTNGQAAMSASAPVTLASDQAVADPCTFKLKTFARINLTASGQIITGTSAKKTYICSYDLVTATAQNIAL